MLSHEIKCIIAAILFFTIACNQHQGENENINRERGIKVLEISKRAIGGEDEYNKLYKQCLDSLNTWCSAKLPGYASMWSDHNYHLDSVLCFSLEKNRMVTAILVQCDDPVCETDAVHYFYGAKIKGQWYFFQGGGTMVVLREHYQKDIHTPVSFEKLHELAMDEMLRGYVKKNKDGVWEINDAFFAAHFEDVGWGDFDRYQDTVVYGKRFANKKEYFESIYLRKSNRKWLYKEKNEN